MKNGGPALIYKFIATKQGFGSDAHVILFAMSGCPHCTNTLPAFMEASKRSSVPMHVIDDTTVAGRKRIETDDITAFPTIMGFKQGRKKLYEGDRSVASFVTFAQNL